MNDDFHNPEIGKTYIKDGAFHGFSCAETEWTTISNEGHRMKVTESSDLNTHFIRYSQLSLTYLNLAVEHKKPKINIFLNANIKKGKTNANNHSQSKYLHSVFRQWRTSSVNFCDVRSQWKFCWLIIMVLCNEGSSCSCNFCFTGIVPLLLASKLKWFIEIRCYLVS